MKSCFYAANSIFLTLLVLAASGCNSSTSLPSKAATTTTLQSSSASAVLNAQITFTATVAETTGTAIPTGTVTFLDGTATLGTGTLNSSGVATYATSALSAGSHSITANYGGDANNSGSLSLSVAVSVVQPVATTTKLQSSSTANTPGVSFTFTATVAPSSGTVIPTGAVAFLDATTTLGTETLNASGLASFSTTTLGSGTHTISASYGGDTGNLASSSSSTTIYVAQNQWRWMGGSQAALAAPVYGAKGAAGEAYNPGARLESGSWTDQNGNFWLFGGIIYDSNGASASGNDLWEYVPSQGTWTWVSGTNQTNQSGIYGTSSDAPGSRDWPTTWVGTDGNLWLFGGAGYDAGGHHDPLGDLWEYNIEQGTWTWKSGADGCCGATSTTMPAANVGGSGWTDKSGNLWFFGGQVAIFNATDTEGTGGTVNELWEYSPSQGSWAFMGGTHYGYAPLSGAVSCTNTGTGGVPGPRTVATSWTDTNGDFWVFGGSCSNNGGTNSFLNDLWKFDPTSQSWTLESGSSQLNASGEYGSLGSLEINNIPGAREYAVGWSDTSGNLWLEGGYGFDSKGNGGYLNDLWEFIPGTGWVWQGGSNLNGATGSYGTPGTPATGNTPAANSTASYWKDSNGNFWLFGGDDGNDLWEYLP